MPSYFFTEPSPSTTTYIRSGRGGAGNHHRLTNDNTYKTSPASSSTPPSAPSASSTQPRRFYSGIGGAGNIHSSSERPALSLDDEFRRAEIRDQAARGHCGIGGAGNVFVRRSSDSSSASASSSSSSVGDDVEVKSTSSRTKLWSRISDTFSRD